MKILKKQLRLEEHKYFTTHLEIVNSVLPIKLTPKEIEILAIFMSFTGELGEDRFNTMGKKIVRGKMGLSHPGLGNYIKALQKKGFLRKEKNGKLKILEILFPEIEEQYYQFKIINIG